MTAAEAREQHAKRVARRREDERLCALDFLTWGDEQGVHAKRCIHRGTSTPVCSFDYSPGPVPDDERLYEGTTLGALWKLPTNADGAVAMVSAARAGWRIFQRRESE